MRWHRLLAVVPAGALLGAPWLVDRIHAQFGGMPRMLVGVVGWVVLSGITLAIIDRLDARHEDGRA